MAAKEIERLRKELEEVNEQEHALAARKAKLLMEISEREAEIAAASKSSSPGVPPTKLEAAAKEAHNGNAGSSFAGARHAARGEGGTEERGAAADPPADEGAKQTVQSMSSQLPDEEHCGNGLIACRCARFRLINAPMLIATATINSGAVLSVSRLVPLSPAQPTLAAAAVFPIIVAPFAP